MADGDSDDNLQTFTNFAGGPFDDIKGKMVNGAMKWYCGCDKQYNQLDGDKQDATGSVATYGFALRLHGAQSTWKFRCSNQPGFALCQKPGPAE